MRVTYIRWSMCLIEMNGLNILTDPVFRIFGLRQPPAGYTVDQLPQLHLIVVSHRHFDHWDRWAMSQLDRDITLLVRPRRIANEARRLGFTKVQELAPWEEVEVRGLGVTATPALHMGGEVGFVFHGERPVYFAGDTSFDAGNFTAIAERFAPEVTILPIGGLAFFGLSQHIDPPQAVEALRLLRPQVVIGTHWGCAPNLPPLVKMPGTPQALAELLAQAGLPTQVRGMRPLDTVEL
ncbi:MAG: MBL fold metallo-hydrolase [Chloroflexota bacterium]|nr:MBL fold metallo-hydrolase [Chloroflexota bacterium]